ncbi:MAG: carboxypeptidase-like regulatory domain-containing protein [Candidatus Sulfopaludibacter sp.]|nr:carboxypeptidase-like regulatory domain-containing protein [Candidatus Sulfopaludibacter sp.]
MPLSHLFLAFLFLQAPKPGSVSGTVTNAATGGPVRKAHITLRAAEQTYTATTDAEGHFAVSGVTPGTLQAQVECAGFQALLRPEPVRVAEEQHVTNVTVALIPNGVITGRVLDENGDPMPQMMVEAALETYGLAGRTLSPRGSMQTDDRGVYRFFDLPAGRYFLMASNPALAGGWNGRVHGDAVETAYVATWFPAAAESRAATANQLAPGAELGGIDIRMRKMRVYHVRGKVVAPGSQQRLDAPVMLAACQTADRQFLYAPILRDGSFDASGVEPGSWCATVTATNPVHGFYARQTVTVTDHDVNDVILTVAATADVRGLALLDSGAPASLPRLPVQLVPLETPGRTVSATIQPDGTFTLANTAAGPYRVEVNSRTPYLKAVRFNGQDAPDGRILVPSSGGQLMLSLATDGGEIGGTASGENALITAFSSSGLEAGPAIAGAGSGGNFLLRNLAPGDYQVLAWETRDYSLVQYAEFRKLFDSRAVSVTVRSKSHETVTLTPVTAAEMEAAKARLP